MTSWQGARIAGLGPRLPKRASQQVGSYPEYTGHRTNGVVTSFRGPCDLPKAGPVGVRRRWEPATLLCSLRSFNSCPGRNVYGPAAGGLPVRTNARHASD
jgi:hypothetical protein